MNSKVINMETGLPNKKNMDIVVEFIERYHIEIEYVLG